MTPLEMAEELVSQSLTLKLAAENGKLYHDPIYEKAFVSYRLMRSAARTIRELEEKVLLADESAAIWERGFVGSQENLKTATEALEFLWDQYKALANSGDAGFWMAEDTEEGKKAMEALARIKETK